MSMFHRQRPTRRPFAQARLPILLLLLLMVSVSEARQGLSLEPQTLWVAGRQYHVQIPSGYVLEPVNTDLRRPRIIHFDANGDLLAGSRGGQVYRLRAPYREAEVLVRLDNYPHSVTTRPGEILVAQRDGVYAAPYNPRMSGLSARAFRRLAALPGGSGHSSRTVRIGPDGRVYASLGIQGNCSDQYLDPARPFEDMRGGILVLDESTDPARWEPHASGLRNPVDFDWQPGSGDLYASNNGPDHWGYEEPRELFSRAVAGSFHGMPWFQWVAGRLQRDACVDSDPPRPRRHVSPPAATFAARNAPMGVAFAPAQFHDRDLAGSAVVALHGSWGTLPSGGASGDPATRRPPKLVLVGFQAGKVVGVEDLLIGFQSETGRRWARPLGVAFGPDGALYFSSDAHVQGIFRLRREQPLPKSP